MLQGLFDGNGLADSYRDVAKHIASSLRRSLSGDGVTVAFYASYASIYVTRRLRPRCYGMMEISLSPEGHHLVIQFNHTVHIRETPAVLGLSVLVSAFGLASAYGFYHGHIPAWYQTIRDPLDLPRIADTLATVAAFAWVVFGAFAASIAGPLWILRWPFARLGLAAIEDDYHANNRSFSLRSAVVSGVRQAFDDRNRFAVDVIVQSQEHV